MAGVECQDRGDRPFHTPGYHYKIIFLIGDCGNALTSPKKFEGHIKIEEFFKGLGEAAAKIGKFLDEHNIKIGLATGTFNITRPQK